MTPASLDGQRFVAPVRTVSAAPSPKHIAFKRGITWLDAVNDQVAGIGQTVVPGTVQLRTQGREITGEDVARLRRSSIAT